MVGISFHLLRHLIVVELGHPLPPDELEQDALEELPLSQLGDPGGADDEGIAVAERRGNVVLVGDVTDVDVLHREGA